MINKKDINSILSKVKKHENITLREYEIEDFPKIQKLYESEGWLTIIKRPDEALKAWSNSHPVIVAESNGLIVGVLRALTDTEITTYVVELLINEAYRGKGIGKSLLDACHSLYPNTRIEVLATNTSIGFYKSHGFRDKDYFGLRKSYI